MIEYAQMAWWVLGADDHYATKFSLFWPFDS
jgi:hypothetical protein